MKTMTCKQMGGPCDALISGDTPDEIMMNGEKHLRENATDEAHMAAVKMMEETANDPELGKQWNDKFMKVYDELPEE